ncbi:arginine:ornithine antiporter/lysine permease [Actinoplanes campanulatus]|uniref:Arginine:ornithine antiporter/lysine permease n=1 Tax=Actinoplanes campanulatus TaxID=113559 RepID=A0A7W5FGJ3_9ACTN|nr:basic amino acid/polyamine antiporter [Actinoplanes campanulatus]MBB3097599.1 arginine:ornithine antiporter/lysine permease [Actinoplanes campanulatus]GGN27776.1 amino acid APC transporter [Actinoplanes campanulatus]GID37938.1 amino acid APC transporter [Actinoplanes campanulatus]
MADTSLGGTAAGTPVADSPVVTPGKMSMPTLTAMVVGGMVGAGVFSLPARFGVATGILGSLIAWAIAGTGMLMLAFVFQNLAVRKPELDSGVFIYAKAGFGDYAGFNSAIGFWASAVAGNAFYWVFISATLGAFFPAFGDGDTVVALVLSTAGVWLFHYVIARGVRDAAIINRIVTVLKIMPILVFIVVLFVSFDAGIFADNWTATGYGDLGSLNEQVRNTMIITTFVFLGIEGASVYSRYAKRREDVGKATVLGFLTVLSIFSLVTLSSYAVMTQPEIAGTRQPSMIGVFEHVVGDWGRWFISAGVIISVLGAYLAWTLMAAEVMYIPAHSEDFPAFLGKENDKATPITALVVTSLSVQLLLAVTLVLTDALNFMLDLCTSLALIPYFLAAAYALKLGLTGDSYQGVPGRTRRRETIIAGIATAYTLFLFEAAGLKFLLLCSVLLAPATLLYVKARSERGRRLFTPTEVVLCILIVAAGVFGVVGLWTGFIAI